MTIYLSEKQIIKMNVVLIKSQTPNEEIGLRDPSGLMAVKQPQQIVFQRIISLNGGKSCNPSNQLNQKHPFHNANKRTAFMATDVFKLNHYETFSNKIKRLHFWCTLRNMTKINLIL